MNNQYSNIELSQNELKALRYLRIPFSHFDRPSITIDVISNRLSIAESDSEYIIHKLLDVNLIQIDPLSKIGNSSITYQISSKGKEYLANRKRIFYSKLFWNLCVPIIASAITSAITTYLMIK